MGTFDRKQLGMWSFSTENVDPHTTPCGLMPSTPPSGNLPATPESLPRQIANPSLRPLRELALNSTMPPLSAQPCSVRFASPLNCNQLDELCTSFVPKQTKNTTTWATGVFKIWLLTRNSTPTLPITDVIPTDLLEVGYPLPVIDRTLAAFVFEARRADGNFYPGSTLKNILAALFRVMKQNQGASFEL